MEQFKFKKIDNLPSHTISQDIFYIGVKVGDYIENIIKKIKILLSKK